MGAALWRQGYFNCLKARREAGNSPSRGQHRKHELAFLLKDGVYGVRQTHLTRAGVVRAQATTTKPSLESS